MDLEKHCCNQFLYTKVLQVIYNRNIKTVKKKKGKGKALHMQIHALQYLTLMQDSWHLLQLRQRTLIQSSDTTIQESSHPQHYFISTRHRVAYSDHCFQ